MEEQPKFKIGSITWTDLTIPNAEELKEFYHEVVGWSPEPISMGDYNDYNMNKPEDDETVAGICHTKGINASMPPQWLIYITVKNLDESIKKCEENGGKLLTEPRSMASYGRFCVIQDPAGAVSALFEQAT